MKNPFRKPEDVLKFIENHKDQLDNLEQNVAYAEANLQDAQLGVAMKDENALAALELAQRKLAQVIKARDEAKGIIAAAERSHKSALDQERAKKAQLDWEKIDALEKGAVAELDECQKFLAKSSERFTSAIAKIHQCLEIVPETDGTLAIDTNLGTARLTSALLLVLRRQGLKHTHPWFKNESEIPNLSEYAAQGFTWLKKKRPQN